MDFTAEEVGQFATDRQAKAGPAVFATGAGISLVEGLEDDLLLLERDTDSGIGDLESNYRGRLLEHRMVLGPAGFRGVHVEANTAAFGELEGVRQKIL